MSTQHYSIIIAHKPETEASPFLFGHDLGGSETLFVLLECDLCQPCSH